MSRITHISHTNITVDHRILRSIRAGMEAGHIVSALGISPKQLSQNGLIISKSLNIDIAVRPIRLKRKLYNQQEVTDESHLEVSQGKTNFFQRLALFFWMTTKISQHVKKHKPEILHAHDTLVLPIALLMKIFFRTKIIYDAHELESNKAGGSAFQNRIIYLFEKICWPWINGFITVSDAIANWYENIFGKPSAVVILNSPEITTQVSRENDKTVRKVIGGNQNDIIFVYVGALEPGRGIEEIISAFRDFSINAKLVFVGDGTLRTSLVNTTQNSQNIFVLEPVPHDYLVNFICTADYGFSVIQNISLSDYLCLPNKMFEYLHAGLTLISSNFPEMSRVVLENQFGYVVEGDSKSIGVLVSSLCNDPRPSKINSSRIVNFTWDNQAKKLINLYASV